MPSPIPQPGGSWRYQPTGSDGRRLSIRWPKVSKRDALLIASHIDHLIVSKYAGTSMPPATAEWTARVASKLHDQLSAAGLVPPRRESNLGPFMIAEINRGDQGESTKTCFHTTRRRLEKFFGADRLIRSITSADARDWRTYCLQEIGLASATVGRDTGVARQFFNYALKQGLIEINPFDELPTTCNPDRERQVYISEETIYRVLEACPDRQWRLVFTFARFGGLRIASELKTMKWDAIHWERNRFTVRSPKTKHHKDGGHRDVPLFPEILVELQSHHIENGSPTAGHVFDERIRNHTNIATPAKKIITRAGFDIWPKTFHNLRSSRQTDLSHEYAAHLVCAWMGNTIRVADRHYHQTTEADFARAAGRDAGAPAGAIHAHKQSYRERETASRSSGSGSSRTEIVTNERNRT